MIYPCKIYFKNEVNGYTAFCSTHKSGLSFDIESEGFYAQQINLILESLYKQCHKRRCEEDYLKELQENLDNNHR